MPIQPSEWRRASFGFFKSTGAAESSQFIYKGKKVKVSTKAAVGMIKGEKIFTSDMDNMYNKLGSHLSTGNRDVPVKATRTIYPVPLTTLAAQIAVVTHMVSYGITNKGTYAPESEYMAAQISAGDAEAAGSRILDDIELVYLSGSSTNLICTLDFGEYDSHCTWKNFRGPIIKALKKVFTDDGARFGDFSRSELVDKAYGEGRMHNTLWDVGRNVRRISLAKLEIESETTEWKDNVLRYRDAVRFIPGVKRIYVPMERVESIDGEFLGASAIGEDMSVLSSHGSGELTTLLFNSAMNAAMSEVALQDTEITRCLRLRLRRYVGDDRIEVYRLKQHVDGSKFDYLKERMFKAVKESGHVINPSKVFFGFGFVEYRQTHSLRGALIPKDQIMLISSEKSKFIDNVQAFIQSYRGVLLTKISRGFSVKLAQKLFWYVVLIVSKISLKRYRIIENGKYIFTERKKLEDKKKRGERVGFSDREKAKEARRQIIIPSFYRYCLPGSMNGGSVHPISILMSMTESKIGMLIQLYSDDSEFISVLRSWKRYVWYKVDAVEESVQEFMRAADPKFINELVSNSTHRTREIAKEFGISSWWPDIPRELVSRSMKMEKRLLGRDFLKAENDVLRMVLNTSRSCVDVGTLEIAESLMQNSGYMLGLYMVVHTEEKDVLSMYKEEGNVGMDLFLDTPALLLRMHYGYGSVDSGMFGRRDSVSRAIARDPIMRNIFTSERLISTLVDIPFDIGNVQEMTVVLMGIGFNRRSAAELSYSMKESCRITCD